MDDFDKLLSVVLGLILAGALALIVWFGIEMWNNAQPVSGVVVDKEYQAPYTTYYWSCIPKMPCTMQTIYHSETWSITIRPDNSTDEREYVYRSLPHVKWIGLEIGDHYSDMRP